MRTGSPSLLNQLTDGGGVPEARQSTSAPVSLEKSTCDGGSLTKNGPTYAPNPVNKVRILLYYLANPILGRFIPRILVATISQVTTRKLRDEQVTKETLLPL